MQSLSMSRRTVVLLLLTIALLGSCGAKEYENGNDEPVSLFRRIVNAVVFILQILRSGNMDRVAQSSE